jgi:uncharacterized membrane protein
MPFMNQSRMKSRKKQGNPAKKELPEKGRLRIRQKAKTSDIMAAVFIIIATLLLAVIVNHLNYNRYSVGMTGATIDYELGKVRGVTEENLTDSEHQKGILVGTQTLLVELLTGAYRGETVTVTNHLSTYNSVVARAGSTLVVVVDALDTGDYQVRVFNYYRAPYIYLLGFVFLVALILVGGKKGLMSGVGLIYTFFCVLLIFLPLVARGYSPVWSAIILVVMVTTATMVFINGISRKTLCAVLGTVCGVVLSGVILFAFEEIMHISGFSTDEAENLLLIGQTTGLKVKYLLFSGILIASMGAVMDTSVSIVSSIYEFHVNMPGMKASDLIRAGMNVGKDMIGTMSNTLILAFTGTSLNMIILLYTKSVQFHQLMNTNYIAIEITQALAASLGIILTVPLTAVLTANLFVKDK